MNEALKTEYEVNEKTIALLAVEEDGKIRMKVMEEDDFFIVDKSPTKVIDASCKYFGSDLSGRISGTKAITNYTHKSPIVVSGMLKLYYFPTMSPSRVECSWISHNFVRDFFPSETDYRKTMVQFMNNVWEELAVSPGVFSNQLERTAQFRLMYEKRFISPVRHSFVSEPSPSTPVR
ncbi:competence protein ComK [Salimicrobium halophilum]|uniref:Competence protein ComK n=1 Tax=Salimicrobium halophilum TaxID=86666 RepID=A0A1G8TR10_9BACI|nr:competence protein ComK [Salimicrobium halophilum]SDJ43843.1 competence protein ComK [Salimicrobium halophilum]